LIYFAHRIGALASSSAVQEVPLNQALTTDFDHQENDQIARPPVALLRWARLGESCNPLLGWPARLLL